MHLKQGDMIVQQATNQGWVNHGSEPCRILFVLMDSGGDNSFNSTVNPALGLTVYCWRVNSANSPDTVS